eukprot:SAG31_NODE_417_length_15907_cov_6.901759_2_plen_133_part_00
MTSYLTVGIAATALCGAADAVGATMRSTVVMMTTPDHLRGRARSGHSLAANAANSVGQVYVAAMASWIGCGATMILGGVLTFAFTALAVQVWCSRLCLQFLYGAANYILCTVLLLNLMVSVTAHPSVVYIPR